ncbi:unnamed protein product [Allacma fusca]|uniref:Uncharacterized protein n=1 Tax=Allacma fusca TaxID=39272 RepID=A0A8J2PLW7_9HEXA|nr:unnamed protein product [Allacma fusca]
MHLHYLLQLGLLYSCLCSAHELNEEDYWERVQELQDPALHFNRSVDHLMKYMLPPGARCDPVQHLDSRILHHSVRHGLLQVPEENFIEILGRMCTVIKEMEVLKFYQSFRCNKNVCDCPFDFLTWSSSEQKCKIRETKKCGDVNVFNQTIINLSAIFGCEAGTECMSQAFAISRNASQSFPNDPSADHPTCHCLRKESCGRPREFPSLSKAYSRSYFKYTFGSLLGVISLFRVYKKEFSQIGIIEVSMLIVSYYFN